ncbi:MAG: CPBP family intramembrane metalloprotease [Nitrospiraceae bacterium]|nr:CPBP family intramembrane metalloprotease [Nitrospiraceae bacterium]
MTLLAAVFLGLVAVYFVYSLVVNRGSRTRAVDAIENVALFIPLMPLALVVFSRRPKARPRQVAGVFLQSVLFALACYYGIREGVFSRQLVSPVHIGIGLAAGHLIFGVSLLVTHRSLRDAATHFVDFGSIWEYIIENPRVLSRFISVGVGEEVIYRVGAQPLLIKYTGMPMVSIVAVALCFALIHEHFFRNGLSQSVEFVGFALLLGFLYYWTGSLILVIVVHAVRNVEIAFLEFLVRIEKAGSEEAAQHEEEYLRGDRVLAMLVAPACGMYTVAFEHAAGGRGVAAADRAPLTASRQRISESL